MGQRTNWSVSTSGLLPLHGPYKMLKDLYFRTFDRIICIDPFVEEAVAERVETQFNKALPYVTTQYLCGMDAYEQLSYILKKNTKIKIGVVGAINYNIDVGVTNNTVLYTPPYVLDDMVAVFEMMMMRECRFPNGIPCRNNIHIVLGSVNDFGTHLEELPIAKFIGRIKFQNGKL